MRFTLVPAIAPLLAIPALVAAAAVPGGWSKVSVEDPGVVAAARFAVAARQAEDGDAARLALEEIVAAERQVVAGLNHRLTLRVRVGDDVRRAEATVWSRPWLEDEKEREQLTAWRFLDDAAGDGDAKESGGAPAAAAAFRRIVLTEAFHAEAAAIGDIDRDGRADVVYGPFWYAGPEFTTRHPIYPAQDFDPVKYSDNFMTVVADVDADGWADVLVNEWPGKAVHWFRNPGKDGLAADAPWSRHLGHPVVDNESPDFLDVTGDGRPELVFHTGGVLGFAAPGANPADDRWTFRPCSERETWGQYQHGLGVGDVDGDGRRDLLMAGGWWRQPADGAGAWTKHAAAFGAPGGAQMHVCDVDGDGDGDVVTSLAAHGYGLSWFEQVRRNDAIEFVEHAILPAQAGESLAGVQFSQPHAVAVADMDGDGARDVVTGKRFWAHGPEGDPDPGGTPVLYWFRCVRTPAGNGRAATVSWEPHLIDDTSGVGTQIAVGDLDADGRPDVVVGNKRGGFVFLQQP